MKHTTSWRTIIAWAAILLVAAALVGCAVESSPERSSAVPGGEFDTVESVPTTTSPPETTTTSAMETTTTARESEPARSRCELPVATVFYESGFESMGPTGSKELLLLLMRLDDGVANRCVDSNEVACPSSSLRAEVVGHTDSQPRSSPGGNQGLSERRAQVVADLLEGRGIETEVSGVADREPADVTDPEQNRRVVVTIICEG